MTKQVQVNYGLRHGYLSPEGTFTSSPPEQNSPMGLFVISPTNSGKSQFITISPKTGIQVTDDGIAIQGEKEVIPLENIEFRIVRGHPVLYVASTNHPLVRLSDQLLDILDPVLPNKYTYQIKNGEIEIGQGTPLGRIMFPTQVQLKPNIRLHPPYLYQGRRQIHLDDCFCTRNGNSVSLCTSNSNHPKENILATVMHSALQYGI